MGTELSAPYRAPGPVRGPYGRPIERTALLIELTAPSQGPFPPHSEVGDYSTPAPGPLYPQEAEWGQGREEGGC